jgi:hypothetical protein
MLAHEPSDKFRDIIVALCVNGIPQARIAAHIGIDAKTMRKFYRRELDLGTERANAEVTANVFRIASTGSDAAAVAAAKYWLGCKGGLARRVPPRGRRAEQRRRHLRLVEAMRPRRAGRQHPRTDRQAARLTQQKTHRQAPVRRRRGKFSAVHAGPVRRHVTAGEITPILERSRQLFAKQ